MTYTDTLEAIKQGLIEYYSKPTAIAAASPNKQSGSLIMFSTVIEDIFEQAKMTTAIKAKTLKAKDGSLLIDDYTITDDERGFFDTICENAATDLQSIFTAFCKTFNPGFHYNVGEIIPAYNEVTAYTVDKLVTYQSKIYKCKVNSTGNLPTNTGFWIEQPSYVDTKGKVIYVIDYDPEYKNTVIQLIDSKIKPCLLNFILAEWYKITGINELYASYLNDYINTKDEIKGHLFNLKVYRRKFTEFPT